MRARRSVFSLPPLLLLRHPTLVRSFLHPNSIHRSKQSFFAVGMRNINDDEPVRLIWHRRDLRLHDNALYSHLDTSSESTTSCLSLYVINPRDFAPVPSTCLPNKWDAIRVGPHAARHLLHALSDLRANLRSIGGELIVRVGDPVDIVPALARDIGATEVHWNEIPGTEETDESQKVFQELCFQTDGLRVVTGMGYSLYHPDDLPPGGDAGLWRSLAHPKQKQSKKKARKNTNASGAMSTNNVEEWPEEYGMPQHNLVDVSQKRFGGMCTVMGDYRRAARSFATVRPALAAPTKLRTPSAFNDNFDSGSIPTLAELYEPLVNSIASDTTTKLIMGLSGEVLVSAIEYACASSDAKSTSCGETAALKRLEDFLNSGRAAAANRALADVTTNDDSSKFSAHLAFGCLSPRTIYEEASKAGEDAKWLVSHMEMRDYFLYYCLRNGSKMFRLDGADPNLSHKKGQDLVWNCPSKHAQLWECWAKGCTGYPLVDAAMKELLQTGHCSNRVRQNAASFLVKDLKIDWRAGAELFQFLLDDFCVAANWGNWAYFSGVGSDPKNRHFRTVSQALRYDPNGFYVKKWFPEQMVGVGDVETLFRPWDFNIAGWPNTIVDPKTQLTYHDFERFEKTGKLLGPGETNDVQI